MHTTGTVFSSAAHSPTGIALGRNQPPTTIDLFGVKEAGSLSLDVGEATVVVKLLGGGWHDGQTADQDDKRC